MDLDLDDLRLVAAPAEGGGARAAAIKVGAHVATVYRRLQTLEEKLGSPLFERQDGAFEPTPAGAELIATARDVLGRLGAMQRRLAAEHGRLVGELTVTTTDSLLPILVQALPAFQKAYPEVRLGLTVSNTMADMARRDADIAVRPTATPPETLIGRRVAPIRYGVYGADGLAPDRWILLDDSLATVPSARWAHRQASGAVTTVNSMWAAAEACAAGMGRAILPDYLARRFPITALQAPVAELDSAVWMLFHPDHRATPRVRYFVREVSEALRLALR